MGSVRPGGTMTTAADSVNDDAFEWLAWPTTTPSAPHLRPGADDDGAGSLPALHGEALEEAPLLLLQAGPQLRRRDGPRAQDRDLSRPQHCPRSSCTMTHQ